MDEESQPEKSSQSLKTLNASLSSSLSNLTASSRALPSNTDFHFYNNFNEFKLPIKQITHHSQSLLETLGSSTPYIFNNDNNNNNNKTLQFPSSDLDLDTDGYDWLVNFNDEILERFDASIDEFKKIRDKEEELGRSLGLDRAAAADNDDGFQLVCGKKKKGVMSGGGGGGGESVVSGDSVVNYSSSSSGVKVVVKDKKAKVPFHIPTIKKPQEEYNILVNNANQPFGHVWLERSEDGTRFVHPLEKLSVLDFVDKDIGDVEPVQPPSIDCTPFKLVEEVKDLKALAAKLRSVNEFAVDLEHNQYRSFQGLTCLMQISTRTEDFVVDTLKLRIHVGPYLREIFKDPTKKKVMHGADRDIVWLQRDFGIYLCNMFDTGQASRVLKLERNSLEYLLHHFCGVTANKEYQNADWRLRPLPDEMLRYAREDTHYLLYIYDLMKIQLHSMPKESEQSDAPLVEVYKRSYDVCMQLYEKELLTENSYLHIYGLQGAGFNAQQLAIVAGLCEWRDAVARAEDESTGYILPNRTLIEIAKQMPVTASKLRRLMNSKHPYVERNLSSVVSIIRHSMRNASEFEAVSQQLKEGHVATATEENFAVNDGSEVFSPVTPIKLKTVSARTESIVGGNAINGYLSAQLPASPQLGSSIAELARDGQGGFFDHPGAKIESDSHTSELSRESLTISGQSSDTNSGTGMSPSAKVTGVTVQVLKKPSRAFGALLGNSASKRKLDTDKKDKEQIKLDQIRSSVNLPFHSFLGQNEQSKAVVEEPNRVLKVSQPEEPPAMPAVRSNVEDFIMLEDDSNVEESIHGSSETTTTPREDKFVGSALDIDKEGEPMSLSDLSTSFQECFQLMNQNKKDGKVEKSQEPSGFLLKPFDYEAAREQVRFGEDPENESGGRGAKNESGLLDSGGRKKSSTVGRVQIDDVTREFAPGKRRQAFPATGNRSTTFR